MKKKAGKGKKPASKKKKATGRKKQMQDDTGFLAYVLVKQGLTGHYEGAVNQIYERWHPKLPRLNQPNGEDHEAATAE